MRVQKKILVIRVTKFNDMSYLLLNVAWGATNKEILVICTRPCAEINKCYWLSGGTKVNLIGCPGFSFYSTIANTAFLSRQLSPELTNKNVLIALLGAASQWKHAHLASLAVTDLTLSWDKCEKYWRLRSRLGGFGPKKFDYFSKMAMFLASACAFLSAGAKVC